jgi:hypothetical protein
MLCEALGKRLDLAISRSGLPPALIGRYFGFDGRTLKSWRLSGVPEERYDIVRDLVEVLNKLTDKGILPLDLIELSLIGLAKLESDLGAEDD